MKNSRGYRSLEPGMLTQYYIEERRDIIFCLYGLVDDEACGRERGAIHYSGLVYYAISGRLYHFDDVIIDLSSITGEHLLDLEEKLGAVISNKMIEI